MLQIIEGFIYYSMGEDSCGTQLKLSAIFSGVIITLLAYRFLEANKKYDIKFLKIIGDCSFGIYFSHMAVMNVLGRIPYYEKLLFYPLNAILTIVFSTICVIVGKRILGKYAKFLAL